MIHRLFSSSRQLRLGPQDVFSVTVDYDYDLRVDIHPQS